MLCDIIERTRTTTQNLVSEQDIYQCYMAGIRVLCVPSKFTYDTKAVNNSNNNISHTKAAKQTKLLTSKEEDKERMKKKIFLIYFIRKKVEKHLQDVSEN